ncbi:hypothetical protein D3C76_1631190 [compost metagenome]
MFREVIQRITLVDAVFLFTLVKRIVCAEVQTVGRLPIGIELHTVDIGLADIEIFINGIGVIAVNHARVILTRLADVNFCDFVLEVGIKHRGVEG